MKPSTYKQIVSTEKNINATNIFTITTLKNITSTRQNCSATKKKNASTLISSMIFYKINISFLPQRSGRNIIKKRCDLCSETWGLINANSYFSPGVASIMNTPYNKIKKSIPGLYYSIITGNESGIYYRRA